MSREVSAFEFFSPDARTKRALPVVDNRWKSCDCKGLTGYALHDRVNRFRGRTESREGYCTDGKAHRLGGKRFRSLTIRLNVPVVRMKCSGSSLNVLTI